MLLTEFLKICLNWDINFITFQCVYVCVCVCVEGGVLNHVTSTWRLADWICTILILFKILNKGKLKIKEEENSNNITLISLV